MFFIKMRNSCYNKKILVITTSSCYNENHFLIIIIRTSCYYGNLFFVITRLTKYFLCPLDTSVDVYIFLLCIHSVMGACDVLSHAISSSKKKVLCLLYSSSISIIATHSILIHVNLLYMYQWDT